MEPEITPSFTTWCRQNLNKKKKNLNQIYTSLAGARQEDMETRTYNKQKPSSDPVVNCHRTANQYMVDQFPVPLLMSCKMNENTLNKQKFFSATVFESG